jgi:3-dehydroquinate synthase
VLPVGVTTCNTLPYPIHIGRGLLDVLPEVVPALSQAHRVAVITDDHVGPHYAARIAAALGPGRSSLISIPPGEEYKTRETWAQITDALLAASFGRDSVLLALGGGVITDLTGFVASTYLRGVPVVHAPTTLLGMVDAAIGGKTGVDTAAGKNLVGTFHPPIAVVADLDVLRTLPPAQQVNGLAEAIKHGVVADASYFDLVANSSLDSADWRLIVEGSVRIKTEIVAGDERESGRRKILNFGHTVGHAIEHLLEYRVPHGACVAFGMLTETRIAIALGLCDPALESQLIATLQRFELPVTLPAALSPHAIVAATATDKKARSGIVEYALPAHCGAMAGAERAYGIPVSPEVVVNALAPT